MAKTGAVDTIAFKIKHCLCVLTSLPLLQTLRLNENSYSVLSAFMSPAYFHVNAWLGVGIECEIYTICFVKH